MPTYEYKCLDCGHKFEALQNMSDDPLEECEKCSGSVKRLIGTGAGIIFKGSGFYETDYKRAEQKEGDKSKSDSGSDGSDGKSGEGENSTGGGENKASSDTTNKSEKSNKKAAETT